MLSILLIVKISPNFIGQTLSPSSLVSGIRFSSFSFFFSGKTGTIESKEASSHYMSGLSSSYVVDSYYFDLVICLPMYDKQSALALSSSNEKQDLTCNFR